MLLGTPLGNTLRTWWEPIGNLIGTCWEQRKNEKNLQPPLSKNLKEKNQLSLSACWTFPLAAWNIYSQNFLAWANTPIRNWGYLFISYVIHISTMTHFSIVKSDYTWNWPTKYLPVPPTKAPGRKKCLNRTPKPRYWPSTHQRTTHWKLITTPLWFKIEYKTKLGCEKHICPGSHTEHG